MKTKQFTKKLNRVLTLVLTIAALMVGQSAWAESSWTVTNSNGNSNTFTIKRSEKGYEQTVHFRTISLSAYAGQHFTAVDMDYTFPADEDEKTVTVTEMNPSTNAYKYQTGASRKYGFEVIDRAGFRLAYAERSKTWGTSVTSSGVFDIKDVTIQTSEYTADDRGYDSNGYKSVAASSYCTSGTQAYLGFLGAELRMTLSFQGKENDDAYEYLQLLFDNTSTCDNRSNCSNGDPGNISLSSYMAGFEMNTGAKDDTYRTYTFPVTSVGNNEGATDPWGYDPTNHKWPLKKQKFKSGSLASDGRIIVPMNFSSIVLRLNASGSSGSDEWAVKNVKAHIQAIDGTNPTKIAVSVNPGRHAKGNTVYVSVAFSEIVTVTGTPTLTTTADNHWGNLTYVDGSGTNVLTFSTTIPQDATGSLNITGLSGTVKDLAGNSLSGSVTASSVCTLDDDFAYTINDFQQEGGNYLIKTHEDLIGLAGYVNGGGATKDKTFLQVADITFAHTTDWNSSSSTENNYTAIGYYKASNDQKNFEGTYDGGGHTISGIRIYRNNNTDSDNYQGLFGHVKSNGAIRNVNLSDTRITGRSTVGGIVGYNMGTVEDCTVAANVCIHQIYGGGIHGGVVGCNLGSVKRCISSAHLTVKNGISTSGYGGIVGRNEKSITDCIATDVVIPDVNARGAIVGVLYNNGPLARNYYHGCKVASDNVTPSGVGQGTANSKTTSDETGAQPLWAVTLPTHASVVRTPATDPLPGTNNMTYDNGADLNGVPYATGSSTVNLSYNPANITEGYDVLLSVKQTSDDTAVTFTDNGDYTYRISMMPTADITVTATEIPIIAYIDADGNPQSHACTPIVEGTTSYQTLGRTEGWYVVNSDVTISGTQGVKFLDQQVNIILCDGTTLTSNATTTGYDGIEVKNGSLAIYGQSLGTGSIVATASNYSAISSKTSINLNGGIISGITNSGYAAITNDSSGGITIRRGNVTATGSTFGIRDLGKSSGIVILGGTVNATATHATNGSGLYSAYGDISIMGGNVTATGSRAGIEAGGSKATTITLGCTTPADRITASSYVCATLTIADGQILSDGTATYSGTLSSEQKTAIAGKTLSAAIPYIDADGTTKYKASKDLTFIKSSKRTYGNAANSEGWYCVNSDVNFTDNVIFNDQMVNIILGDGATLSCEKYSNYHLISANNGSLAIYGQTHGTGTLSINCTANGSAIFAYTNIDINGGTINAASLRGVGIKANNAITIRRGNITTKGNEYGFSASTVTLGCATTADRIYSTGYNGTVTIADGQTLTDGYSANTYANTLTDKQKDAITKKTMMKALGNVSYIDENGQEQTCSNYTILSDGILEYSNAHGYIGTTKEDTWYVASGNYTIATYLETCGRVHIILCDGACFTVNGSGEYGIYATSNLSIYGQSQGTGTLTANVKNASGKALYISSGNLVVNGGVVSAHGGEYGIYVRNGSMTVNGGSINATGTTSGIYVRDNLTLGWNKLSDRITANSYSCTGTISVKEGQQLHNGSSLLSGTLYNHNGGNPTGDLSVLAGLTLKPAVPYITADGTTQYCGEYTVLESSNEQFANYGISGQENWYVVSGDVTINGRLQFNNSHSHLIVCDGATLTVTSSTGGYDAIRGKDNGDGITIYGQTQQSGTVNATSSSNAIYARGPVTINGGIINATGYDGIFVGIYGITINGGSITATGSGYGISGTNVTINGGTVSATGSDYGIYAGETITLGWTNPTDRIYANSYSKNPVVKSGQTLTDGTNAYSGSVNKSNIAGQTLQPCYSITLPAHVVATGVICQNGTTAYAMPPAAITLSAEANFALANVEVNGNAATDNGNGTWNFQMPAEDVTVTATVKVPYIAADGTTQYCTDFTVIETSNSNVNLGNINNDEAWYVVPAGEVAISGRLRIRDKAVHLILCDGAELTVTESSYLDAVSCPRSLTIYGQSAQSGSLTATATGSTACGIKADEGDITVNGGIINATSNNYKGIWASNLSSGNVTINRGSVTATSKGGSFSYGIYANNNVTINGGIVSATGNSDGIYASGGTITLGWTNPTDRITASSYNRNPVVKSGQTLTDGTNTYSGSVNSSNIAGMTLWPDLWDVAGGNDGSTAEKAYTITTTGGLDQLAAQVNSGNFKNFEDKFFRLGNDITYTHTTNWDDATSTENNYTAIGAYINGNYKYFCGTFDGQGYTVRGIRIYKGNDDFQGLFGSTLGATIKNVILADARITGRQNVGGIAGYITINSSQGGIVENCRVGSDVILHAVANYAYSHGGVVGNCNGGTISGCVSAATLTKADGLTGIQRYGGIAGNLSGTMSDCLALGCSVPAVEDDNYGAIAVDVYGGSTLTNCYYRDCKVGNAYNQSDAYTVSAGTDVTVAPTGSADQTYPHDGIQRYGSSLYYNGVLYAPEAADVSLTLGNTVTPAELFGHYTATAGTLSGTENPYTLTMPAQDVTINAFLKVPYIDENGVEQLCADYTVIDGTENDLGTDGETHWYVVKDVVSTGRLVFYDQNAHLILCDGSTLSVYDEYLAIHCYSGSLTIYGQSLQSGTLNANANYENVIYAESGNITINGGNINAQSGHSTAINANGNITINGGNVRAIGSNYSFNASTITLGWTNPTDRIYASHPYACSTLKVKDGLAFADQDGNLYSGTIYSGPRLQNYELAGKTLSPVLVLADNADNTSAIATNNGSTLAVQLTDRTLYKDGDWNTLCLPFQVSTTSGPLAGDNVVAMTLNTSESNLTGTTLTLNFDAAPTTIPAGTPFIIKWGEQKGKEGYLGTTIENPVFTGVTIDKTMHNTDFTGGTFKGTYERKVWNEENKSILFVGENNMLYWPTAGGHVNACRAYFDLGTYEAREFVLNFDDQTTGVIEVKEVNEVNDDSWYTLNGVKLSGKPTKSGLYIHGNRKIVIK